jgi:signal transduction histidine kinase
VRMLADVAQRGCLWRFKGRISALALVLVLISNWGWQTLRDRDIEIAAAETRVSDMARAAEYQVDGSVRSIAALMEEAADRIDPARWPDMALQQWFSARLVGFPEIRNIILTDARGRVVGAIVRPGQVLPGWSEDLSDREYFINSVKQFPVRRFYVPKPVVSRFSHQASIPLVQSIVGRHGEFAGMVVAGVDPAVFRDQMNAVLIEPEGGASLIRSDGTFLGRMPNHDQFLGQSVASSPLFREYIARAPNGVAHFVSVADGNEKIVAFRTLPNYPLVVTVGITRRTALARWHAQAIAEASVLLVVLSSLLAWLYDLRAVATQRLTEELAANRDLLEQQVADRTAHLAASNAELEQFAYVASHDLQEPLRTISGFLQLLARRYHGQLDAEADEFIDFAVGGAKRMGTLINDLLAFSRVGRNDIPDEPCHSEALAQAAATSLGSAVAECGATITIGPLPKVWCRPAELQSVFLNLMGNAVKYRDEARPPVVAVSAMAEGGMVRFAVADNGIGIDAEYHDRIFGLFQRLHPRDRFEGTGIGLALCRKIVDRHGGRIWLESVPGQGTTMMFTLRAA